MAFGERGSLVALRERAGFRRWLFDLRRFRAMLSGLSLQLTDLH